MKAFLAPNFDVAVHLLPIALQIEQQLLYNSTPSLPSPLLVCRLPVTSSTLSCSRSCLWQQRLFASFYEVNECRVEASLTMHAHKIAVGPPQAQEMSTTLLVANSSNMPSGSVPVNSTTALHNQHHEASHSVVLLTLRDTACCYPRLLTQLKLADQSGIGRNRHLRALEHGPRTV